MTDRDLIGCRSADDRLRRQRYDDVSRRSAYTGARPWRPDLGLIPDLDFFLRFAFVGDFHRVAEVLADFRMH